MKVIVVGAGVVGAAVSRAAARRGDEVTLIEARTPGSGTSGTSFGWINANTKEPQSYFELNMAGMNAHRQLAGSTTSWWVPKGNLEWASSERDASRLESRVERLRARGYDAQLVTAMQAAALEPDRDVPGHARTFAVFAQEAHCFPMLLIARLLAEARDHGARFRWRTSVLAVESGADCARVVVDDVEAPEIRGDVVICCVGRWTPVLLRDGPGHVPMLGPGRDEATTLGYLATTAPVPVDLSRILTTPTLNVRPAGGGRLLLQALDLDPESSTKPASEEEHRVTQQMLDRLGDILPDARGAEIERLLLGRRAIPADGLTTIGFAHDAQRIYTIATHSGITLAPLLGELASQEIHGHSVEMLASFRPDRESLKVDGRGPAPARKAGEQ